ncbi:MAG TPA: FtsQ-type POTRA domain-containing protein, partial [Gaiellaceae bacterium]|nr:FtsQ-type POTRA domain-containing protein [Gaiellaceae bacterium]
MGPPRRGTARAAALPAGRPLPSFTQHLPSARSLAISIALLALAVGAYVLARQTSVFALREVDVRGGTPALKEQVREALAPEFGRSLVALRPVDVESRLAAVPGVLAVRMDRDFPHTLRLVITPERPVLLL